MLELKNEHGDPVVVTGTHELSKILGLSKNAVEKLAKKKFIPHIILGSRKVFNIEEVRNAIRRMTLAGQKPVEYEIPNYDQSLPEFDGTDRKIEQVVEPEKEKPPDEKHGLVPHSPGHPLEFQIPSTKLEVQKDQEEIAEQQKKAPDQLFDFSPHYE